MITPSKHPGPNKMDLNTPVAPLATGDVASSDVELEPAQIQEAFQHLAGLKEELTGIRSRQVKSVLVQCANLYDRVIFHRDSYNDVNATQGNIFRDACKVLTIVCTEFAALSGSIFYMIDGAHDDNFESETILAGLDKISFQKEAVKQVRRVLIKLYYDLTITANASDDASSGANSDNEAALKKFRGQCLFVADAENVLRKLLNDLDVATSTGYSPGSLDARTHSEQVQFQFEQAFNKAHSALRSLLTDPGLPFATNSYGINFLGSDFSIASVVLHWVHKQISQSYTYFRELMPGLEPSLVDDAPVTNTTSMSTTPMMNTATPQVNTITPGFIAAALVKALYVKFLDVFCIGAAYIIVYIIAEHAIALIELFSGNNGLSCIIFLCAMLIGYIRGEAR